MLKTKLIAFYNLVVNRLSFYHGLYKMRRWLNAGIDRLESIESFPESHPRGFIKKFRKRRISIVESYAKIIGFLESDKYNERLDALKLLARHVLHSRSLEMPLNTARVQLALMKEAVKNRDNKRVQLERLRDFSVSSFGKPKFIRKYLKELNIIEVPETGQQLKDLYMGWDSHVHDNSSYGRKTPTQLIIDAFIKGISQLTVVYNTLSEPEIIKEAIEAGHILGITVNIGLEFYVGGGDNRFHYIYLLPHFENKKELNYYLKSKKEDLNVFIRGLEEVRKNRVLAITAAIQNFNLTHRPKINHGYPKGSIYYLEKLALKDIEEIVPLKHVNRMHLGEFLYTKYQPVLFNRVLMLKARKKRGDSLFKNNRISQQEYISLQDRYEAARKEYRELNPETLRLKYFAHPKVIDDLPAVFNRLKDVFKGGEYRKNIKIIHPLEHGFTPAITVILENYQYIGHAEIYNMHDGIYRDHDELRLFAVFLDLLNHGHFSRLKEFLEENHIEVDKNQLKQCATFCKQEPIIPACGSDSTGRTSYIPGMGFIFRGHLVKKQYPDYLKNHYTLPDFVSRMIAKQGGKETDEIISMGKVKEIPAHEIGDEKPARPIPVKQAWRYINPATKNIFYIFIGFIPAYLTVGLGYSLVWFGITLIRNAIADIISGRGYHPKEWHLKNIDFDNLSHSLFWTGFSVPLLGFVKNQFDLLYPFHPAGFLFEFEKFFFICIVNGVYISAHNRLRGFDKTTIRINFFRTLLAWPFASVFAPVGAILTVPSIVQAKFWSDFVAGLIEGWGKFNQRISLRKRDLKELFPNIRSGDPQIKYIAILDLLYLFRKDPRTRNSLKFILFKSPKGLRKLLQITRLKKRKIPKDFTDYDHLRNWFSESIHFSQLTDFLLENFKEDQVIYLTDLVSESFPEFHRWLVKNEPKRRPGT
jgi:hypothetical protein